jgi:hypothetical protein
MKRNANMIRSERGQLLRSTAAACRSMGAVLSTGLVARDNHKIDPKGWVYGRSVPLIDSHRDAAGIASVIGRVTDIHVGRADVDTGDNVPALLGTLTFAEADVNSAAETAFRLYSAGFADSVSVSFIPREYTAAHDRGGGAMNISSAELLEVSAVGVPSDVNAKVLARAIRSQMRGQSTAADRAIIAAAIQARIEQEDMVAGRSIAERADRARAIRARLLAERTP